VERKNVEAYSVAVVHEALPLIDQDRVRLLSVVRQDFGSAVLFCEHQ
jgi:hypothetical protein